MPMKKLFFIATMLIILSTFGNLKAQESVAGADVIKLFMTTTTCIVLDDNIFNTYNNEVKTAVEKSWTITPYEFISYAEFEKRKFNDNYSFLVRTKDTYKADADKMNYRFLSLLQGGKYGSVYHMPTLCSFPIAYYESSDDNYYEMGAIVRFVQNHVNLTKEHPELSEKNIIQYYNKNVTSIGNKTLYLIDEQLAKDVNTDAEIKPVYSKKFKIVKDEDDIKKLIKAQDPNVVFLHKVGPPVGSPKAARCFKIVMGTDGSIYYVDFHKISAKTPDGFLKSDFKALNKN